jgi:hypothetical protein
MQQRSHMQQRSNGERRNANATIQVHCSSR